MMRLLASSRLISSRRRTSVGRGGSPREVLLKKEVVEERGEGGEGGTEGGAGEGGGREVRGGGGRGGRKRGGREREGGRGEGEGEGGGSKREEGGREEGGGREEMGGEEEERGGEEEERGGEEEEGGGEEEEEEEGGREDGSTCSEKTVSRSTLVLSGVSGEKRLPRPRLAHCLAFSNGSCHVLLSIAHRRWSSLSLSRS